MSMENIKEYLTLYSQLQGIDDMAIREAIWERMDKIWYYYLSPADIQYVKSQLGEPNEPGR